MIVMPKQSNSEIADFKRNSPSNEDLAIQAKQGDQNAALQLWEQVRRFVRMMARRRLPNDGSTNRVDMDDLMQSGYLGMAAAVQNYDPNSGCPFVSVLRNHVRTAFAKEIGYHTTRRDALLWAVSIDAPSGPGDDKGDLTISDMLAAPSAEIAFEDMLDRVGRDQAFQTVMKFVDKLEPEQEAVIRLYYLLGLNYRETALAIGKKPSEVRKNLQKALRQLRCVPEIRKIGEELYKDEHTNFWLHISLEAFQSGAGSAVEHLAEQRQHIKKAGNGEV